MTRRLMTLLMLSLLLVTSACQTTKHSVPSASVSDPKVICTILDEVDTLPTLTDEETRLILDRFSWLTKDKLKAPESLKREFKC